jgi:hypothetical protein
LMRNQTPISGNGGQYYQSPVGNSQSTNISGGNDPFYDYQGQSNVTTRPTNPASAPLGFGLNGTNAAQPQLQTSGGQLNNPFDTYLASKGLAGGRFDTSNPAYQFQLKQGQQALDRSAAARGMGYSGAQMKAAQQYGQGLASQEYDKQYNRASGEFGDYFNRLAGLAQGGQQAVGSMAQAGSQYASNAGNTFANLSNAQTGILGQQANARASGYAANANAITGGLNSLTNLYGMSKYGGGNKNSLSSWLNSDM